MADPPLHQDHRCLAPSFQLLLGCSVSKPTYHHRDLRRNLGFVGGAARESRVRHRHYSMPLQGPWDRLQPSRAGWARPPARGGGNRRRPEETGRSSALMKAYGLSTYPGACWPPLNGISGKRQALSPFAVWRGCVSACLFGSAVDSRANSEQLVSSEQTVAL